MCGIAGIIHKQARDYIDGMSEAIAHRGPDGTGFYFENGMALVHHRLAIQDLSDRAAQPMYTQDGKHLIILNGEIYNHWEIRKEFLSEINFITTSDTETLLYGYVKFGSEIVNKLNGIFAFAIYSIETKELFIARDQFGVNPLYYYVDEDAFLFSSEIKSFLEFPGLNKKPDYKSLFNYISFLYSPGPSTPFENVKKLEAGHTLRMNIKDLHSIKIQKYYEIPFSGKYSQKSEEELIDELDQRLKVAVKRQLLSDVPVGYFLSGGLDSSLIVAMAKQLFPDKKLKCFTIETHYDGREGFTDDLPYAKKVAAYLDVDLEIVKADIDIVKDFDRMIWHLDEPQADAAPLNVLNISKRAREQGFIVLLGGTGGDDLFSGYRRHSMIRYQKLISLIPIQLFQLAGFIFSKISLKTPLVRRISKMLDVASNTKNSLATYYLWLATEKVRKLFAPRIQNELKEYDPESILLGSLQNIPLEHDPLNLMLYWDMKYFLPDHNLNYTNKMGMAHGVEIRVPYLDKDLVEFSTKIPPQLKLKGKTTKYILKKVAERYLPNEIIYRPKTGFGAPVRDWMVNDLYDKTREIFDSKNCDELKLFDCKEVLKLVEENRSGKVDASYSIFSLLAINSWYNQFMRKEKITGKSLIDV